MKDLDEMKRQWGELNERLESLESKVDEIYFANRTTALDRLRSKYKRLGLLGFLGGAGFFFVFWKFFDSVAMGFCYTAFLWLCGGMDFLLMRKVGSIDIASMTVSEVAENARVCRRLHHRFQLILLPLAVLILIGIWWIIPHGEYVTWWLAGGVALGLAISIPIYLRMMGDYKALIAED